MSATQSDGKALSPRFSPYRAPAIAANASVFPPPEVDAVADGKDGIEIEKLDLATDGVTISA